MHRYFILLTLLFALYSTSHHAQCDVDTGTTERQSYRSSIALTTMHYTVYLPPCYDAERSEAYPTVYLLHGSAQYDDHWLQIGLDDVLNEGIASGQYPPMIVVLPYGEWIANENRFDSVSFERVFLDELMPAVESNYNVSTEKATRAIGGISRGGFWAYVIGLRHPELFSAIGGHSAFFDLYHAPPEFNPLDLALTAANINTLQLSIDRGAYDYAREGLDLMDERLKERGVDYTYTVNPTGEHNNLYWQEHVSTYLDFYVQSWERPAITPPSLDTGTFVFTPPRDTPNPSAFTFTPPKADTTSYDVVLPVITFGSTRYNVNTNDLLQVTQGNTATNGYITPEALAVLNQNGYPSNTFEVATIETIDNLLRRNRDRYALITFDQLTTQRRILHVDEQNPLLTADTYPLAFENPNGHFDDSQFTTLTLSGVTAITRSSIPVIDDMGTQWATSGIAPYTTQVDFFHTSNEVSFTDSCPQSNEPTLGAFCSKTAHFDIFEQIGLDIVELTGNHNNDYGFNAYLDTLSAFEQIGVQTVGGGASIEDAQRPLILSHGGNQIAMLACNDVGPYYALVTENQPGAAACGDWMQPVLASLQATADVIIVSVQHTEFEEYLPRDDIQYDFRRFADWGADVVVGTHAHKPQTFEFYQRQNGDVVFLHYGLGNFFFDQPFWGNSRFWMDTLLIYDNQLVGVDIFTGIIDQQARPRPMTPEERQNFLDFMFIVHNGVQ